MERSNQNYFYLEENKNLSKYISNIINTYQKKHPNKIFHLTPICLLEEYSALILFSSDLSNLYMTYISLNSKDNKYREIKINFPKKKFILDEINLTSDKKHLILFNQEKNQAFIILNYTNEILSNNNDNINLEQKNFFEITKGKILDIKFNERNNDDINDDNLVIYAIKCDNNILSIFNTNYPNKEFQIFFKDDISDYHILKNKEHNYDLYIMNNSGFFSAIKNINDVDKIPKSDESELILKIKSYDKILYNINNININSTYNKCYLVSDNNIISVIRTASSNIIDIGMLINDKIFWIKKYSIENNERIYKIIKINEHINTNYNNKFLISTDKNNFLLNIPYLSILFSMKNKNNINEIISIINEMISKINFTLLLKLPNNADKNSFCINYNFYMSNILCIKKNKIENLIVKIYEFQIDNKLTVAKNNNNIIYDDKNELNNEKNIMMNLKINIEQDTEIFQKNEININQKEEYFNKIIEEIFNSINNSVNINNSPNNNINQNLDMMNDAYSNAYFNIKLYGDLIKNKYDLINNNIEKIQKYEKKVEKSNEIIDNLKKRIENKIKIVENNEKEILMLKKENANLINDYYILSENNNQQKNFTNELIQRINHYLTKNISFVENNIINNSICSSLDKINFEKMKNFPLNMKYLDDSQKEKLKNIINSVNNLSLSLKNLHEKFNEKNNK